MATPTSCATIIICGLSAPIRAALVGAVSGMIGILQLQVAKLRIAAAALNIATLPLAAMGDLLQTAADGVSAIANLVPLRLAAGCGDFGVGVEALNEGIDFARVDIDRQIARINRNLAFGDQLQAKINRLEAAIAGIEEAFIRTAELCNDSNA